MIELRVNGALRQTPADAGQPLLGVLRDEFDLTGAKYGCGEGQCGACVVLVDGEPLPSCITPVGNVAGREIGTIEGLGGPDDALHPVQQAFLDQEAFQCGYCTPGMVLASVALLNRHRNPTEQEIIQALQPNLCRCGSYSRIVCAVRQAAQTMRRDGEGGSE